MTMKNGRLMTIVEISIKTGKNIQIKTNIKRFTKKSIEIIQIKVLCHLSFCRTTVALRV